MAENTPKKTASALLPETRIPQDLYDWYVAFAKKHGTDVSDIIREALWVYRERHARSVH
ncbi:MAG: hypothetical protein HGB11_03195 [Chlorobiales bacterium]|jgi:hypothetical protein|nr:hypothetical protein [Chlorobiales bacterium]